MALPHIRQAAPTADPPLIACPSLSQPDSCVFSRLWLFAAVALCMCMRIPAAHLLRAVTNGVGNLGALAFVHLSRFLRTLGHRCVGQHSQVGIKANSIRCHPSNRSPSPTCLLASSDQGPRFGEYSFIVFSLVCSWNVQKRTGYPGSLLEYETKLQPFCDVSKEYVRFPRRRQYAAERLPDARVLVAAACGGHSNLYFLPQIAHP